jgi:hypothetical protein
MPNTAHLIHCNTLEAWQVLTKNAGSGSVSGSALKPMRIRSTGSKFEEIFSALFLAQVLRHRGTHFDPDFH